MSDQPLTDHPEGLRAVDGGEPLDDDQMTARDDLRAYLAGAHAAGLPEKSCRSLLALADAMVESALRSTPTQPDTGLRERIEALPTVGDMGDPDEYLYRADVLRVLAIEPAPTLDADTTAALRDLVALMPADRYDLLRPATKAVLAARLTSDPENQG